MARSCSRRTLIRAELARHSRPRQIAAHAQGTAGILAAIRGGVDSVEHGYEIDDEGIELMLERGTFLVPTLSAALRVPDPAAVPPYLYEKKVRWSEIARENVSKAIHAAELLGLASELGTLEVGKVADFVAVPVDPLTDIATLADPGTIELVVKDGIIVKDLMGTTAGASATRARM
ncbi:amidohydrolase family protein [Kibdelosporangium aridum]|uniref:amidohydrolase family protein n=1 Tax=Kibdelosporangium aridum TaxID=2030 RepID=UPI00190E94EA|nr:amidohydrolase family protein [Kibdelosporangium aridum]